MASIAARQASQAIRRQVAKSAVRPAQSAKFSLLFRAAANRVSHKAPAAIPAVQVRVFSLTTKFLRADTGSLVARRQDPRL